MRIGIVISSAAAAAPTHTTVHIAHAACEAGHAIRFFEPWDFEIDVGGRIRGRAHAFDGGSVPSRESLAASLNGRTAVRRSIDVDRLDVLLLRMNPIDTAVVTVAQLAAAAGVRVLNDPHSMLRISHKSWLATLADVPRPRTIVTRSRCAIDTFASSCESGVVVKPARACGGRAVAIVRSRRRAPLDEAVEAAIAAGDGYVIVQEYLTAAVLGEKRLLWHAGRVLGGYLRMRAPGEFRHNLKMGGQPMPCTVTAGDDALAARLTPHLLSEGVWLAGIDVIGDRVVEVNTLNPGGVHYTESFTGPGVSRMLLSDLEVQNPAPRFSMVST